MKHINSNEMDDEGEFPCPVCESPCEWSDSGCSACGETFSHHHVGGLEEAIEFVQHRSLAKSTSELDVVVCPNHGPRGIIRQFNEHDESEKWCPQCGVELEIQSPDRARTNDPGEVLSKVGEVVDELQELDYNLAAQEAERLYQLFGTSLVQEQVDDS